jgi:GT2 family glycosyltransferase
LPGDEAGKAGTMTVNIPKVFCIIPVRNRKEITKRCLEYLDDQDYPALHIIIVDDGSTDGTGEYLEQCMRPNLTVLKGDGNLWWGGAMHMGMKFVSGLANDRDYILMLNDDVRIEKNYVSILVNESMKNVGSVVGSVNRDESTGYIIDCGYQIDFWRMRILLLHGIAGETVDAMSGRGVLLPYAIVRCVGIVRPKLFPHYLSDLDYTSRIRQSGCRLIVSLKAAVFVSSESSDKKIREKGWFPRYFSWRSKDNLVRKLLFFSIHGPFLLRLVALPRYLVIGGWRLRRRMQVIKVPRDKVFESKIETAANLLQKPKTTE